jgi:4a-hydroxytetrahydrobiopterin dehydratase
MICASTTTRLAEQEISKWLSLLNGWSRGEHWIEKQFSFKNFLRAMSFVNAVADLAETVNHHPDIIIHYNQVKLKNWTHVAGGITEYDFMLAEQIEALPMLRTIKQE